MPGIGRGIASADKIKFLASIAGVVAAGEIDSLDRECKMFATNSLHPFQSLAHQIRRAIFNVLDKRQIKRERRSERRQFAIPAGLKCDRGSKSKKDRANHPLAYPSSLRLTQRLSLVGLELGNTIRIQCQVRRRGRRVRTRRVTQKSHEARVGVRRGSS